MTEHLVELLKATTKLVGELTGLVKAARKSLEKQNAEEGIK